jgi:dihydroorotate dehydrogenase electron transfer subunit
MFDLACKVLAHDELGAGYRMLELQAGAIADAATPGQFVHLRVPALETSALRRPFSIYGAEDGTLSILYKTVGRGTLAMNALKTGETVQVLGPIGRGFPLNPSGVPVLIGGGYGVAPLRFLAERLPRKGAVLIGGRTETDILCRKAFAELGWPVVIATQDGSLGEAGLVTQPLDRTLDEFAKDGRTAELFCCGPDGLLKAVGERAIARGCKAWLSLDKRMVCGAGACLACVQKLRKADGTEWLGRVCVDGPVFESREIVW